LDSAEGVKPNSRAAAEKPPVSTVANKSSHLANYGLNFTNVLPFDTIVIISEHN
jgi:hypothetical protein